MNDFVKNFVMRTITDSIGNVPDYKVRSSALGWFKNGVLTEENLIQINDAIEKRKNDSSFHALKSSDELDINKPKKKRK